MAWRVSRGRAGRAAAKRAGEMGVVVEDMVWGLGVGHMDGGGLRFGRGMEWSGINCVLIGECSGAD